VARDAARGGAGRGHGMKGLIVNIVAGTGMFAAALFGTLAATGRLDHAGTANIPLVSALFPAPPANVGKDADHGAVADAPADGHGGQAADAAEPRAQEPAAQAPQQSQQPQEPRTLKKGRSITGEGKADAEQQKPEEHAPKTEAARPPAPAAEQKPPQPEQPADQDFHRLEQQLAQDRTNRYAPGGYFRFDGMPSGITAEKLNEAWQRVQDALLDVERRSKALDLREHDLKLLGDDIQRRWTELGKERAEIEALQARVDEKLDRFKEQVKLVRNDEVAGLKRNAQTLASFEPSKAAELVQEQWKMEGGQDEVLKTLEFMQKDAVNAMLAALPNPMIRDVLQKRLHVSKEPAAPAAPGK
jgi:hypothetical protein